MNSQALRCYMRIIPISESLSIREYLNGFTVLLELLIFPMAFRSSGFQAHFVELVARNRDGMVAPENEQRNSSLV